MGDAHVTLCSHASHQPESIILISHLYQVSYLPSSFHHFAFISSFFLQFPSFLFPGGNQDERSLAGCVSIVFLGMPGAILTGQSGQWTLGLWTVLSLWKGQGQTPIPRGSGRACSASTVWAGCWDCHSLAFLLHGIPILCVHVCARACAWGNMASKVTIKEANWFIVRAEPFFSLKVNFVRLL